VRSYGRIASLLREGTLYLRSAGVVAKPLVCALDLHGYSPKAIAKFSLATNYTSLDIAVLQVR
jgi:hypothetical protein